MRKQVRNLALPAMLALSACGTTGNQRVNLEDSTKVAAIELDYGRNFVKARFEDIAYERYEHIGFDGHNYCVQIVDVELLKTPEEVVYIKIIDGDNGACDNIADSFIVRTQEPRLRMTQFCDSNALDGHCIEATMHLQNFLNSHIGRAISYVWNRGRDICKKDVCKATIEILVREGY